MHQSDLLRLVGRRFCWPGLGCHPWHLTYLPSVVPPSTKYNPFNEKQEICGNRIKAGFFNVIIQHIAVHGTMIKNKQ